MPPPDGPMEQKIQRPQAACAVSGRAFQPGDALVSALVRSPEGIVRVDVAPAAWNGPPEKAIAWWRSVYPRPDAPAAVTPSEVLLDIVERLGDDPADREVRYLVALELVRRRVLRFLDQAADALVPDGTAPLRLACRKRDAVYEIAVAPPPPDAVAAVESRLASLLWSGEAA